MKSIRFSVVAGVAVAVSLAAAFFVVDHMRRARIELEAQNILNAISLPLLEEGNPTLLFGQLDEGIELISPDMTYIIRYLPLVQLEAWQGEINVPSVIVKGTPSAALRAIAQYSGGTAEIRAQMAYRTDEWRIQYYEVIPGPAAQ